MSVLPQQLLRLPSSVQTHGAALLLVSFVGVLTLWLTLTLIGLIGVGEARGFDAWLASALRKVDNPAAAVGPAWLLNATFNITALGSIWIISLMTAAAITLLALLRRYREALLLIVAITGAQAINALMKLMFVQPRPDADLHLAIVSSASFPSGHSMSAAVMYPLLALLLTAHKPLVVRNVAFAFGVLMVLMVGFSRVYLGVHYPSDVLAGWCGGLLWSLLCWSMFRIAPNR